MKMIKVMAMTLFAAVLLTGCNEESSSQNIEMKSFKDSVSYSFGILLSQNLKGQASELNADIIAGAIRDALDDSVTQKLTVEQCQQVFATFSEQKAAEAGETGRAYLRENATKEGVSTTASGLQYKILQEGTGDYPTVNSNVSVFYRGTLIDGTEFDGNIGGSPISFSLGGVIAGWTEGLQLINEGGKIELTIPHELGYGARGSGPIPPSATLIFEVELVSIN